jgi:hypothetical protein
MRFSAFCGIGLSTVSVPVLARLQYGCSTISDQANPNVRGSIASLSSGLTAQRTNPSLMAFRIFVGKDDDRQVELTRA